jgi:hypothetical protein
MVILSNERENIGRKWRFTREIEGNLSQSSGYLALDFNLSLPEYIGMLTTP